MSIVKPEDPFGGFDVPQTRSHYYNNFLVFHSSTPLILLPRQSLGNIHGRSMNDLLILLGIAKPVPILQEPIAAWCLAAQHTSAGAMYSQKFLKLMADTNYQHEGFKPFLRLVAIQTAVGIISTIFEAGDGHNELDDPEVFVYTIGVVSAWDTWYQDFYSYQLNRNDLFGGFESALYQTKLYVTQWFGNLHVNLILSQTI